MSDVPGPIGEAEIYAELARVHAAGQDAVLATVIQTARSTPRHPGSKMLVFPDGRVCGSIGGGRAEARVIEEAAAVLADGECRRLELDLKETLGVCGGWMEVFLEPVSQGRPFVVIGAGHVGRAVVDMARTLPLRLTLVDDRPDFLAGVTAQAGLRTLEAAPSDLASLLTVQPGAGVLVASRNHELDGAYLKALLEVEAACGREFAYLGALGSRTKAARVRQDLTAAQPGVAERLERLQMPVGLDLAAETPGEIALSVLAEAWAVLQGGPLLTLDDGQALGVRLHRHRQRKPSAEES